MGVEPAHTTECFAANVAGAHHHVTRVEHVLAVGGVGGELLQHKNDVSGKKSA